MRPHVAPDGDDRKLPHGLERQPQEVNRPVLVENEALYMFFFSSALRAVHLRVLTTR